MKTLRNFEVIASNGGICNNLELVELIYVRYKNTNSRGIILHTTERNIFYPRYYEGKTPIYFIYLPLLDRNGNKYQKRMNVSMESIYFEIIPAFDISFINKNWVDTIWTDESIKEFNLEMFNKY